MIYSFCRRDELGCYLFWAMKFEISCLVPWFAILLLAGAYLPLPPPEATLFLVFFKDGDSFYLNACTVVIFAVPVYY